jgi:hypothetical protein
MIRSIRPWSSACRVRALPAAARPFRSVAMSLSWEDLVNKPFHRTALTGLESEQ